MNYFLFLFQANATLVIQCAWRLCAARMRYGAMCSAAWEAYEQALNENHHDSATADFAAGGDGGGATTTGASDATTATDVYNYQEGYYSHTEQWPNEQSNSHEAGEESTRMDHSNTAYDNGSGWNEEGYAGASGSNEGNADEGIDDDDDDEEDDDDDEEEKEWVDPQVREAVMFCRHGRKLQLANLLGTGFSPDSRGERGRTLLM